MAIQERAACWDCGKTFDVTPLPPPPTYCGTCRAKPDMLIDLTQLRRDVVIVSRPEFITCFKCGRSVSVKKRGRIPTQCRGGCPASRIARWGDKARPRAKKDDSAERVSKDPGNVRPARNAVSEPSRYSDGPADPWAPRTGPVYLTDVMQERVK